MTLAEHTSSGNRIAVGRTINNLSPDNVIIGPNEE
jgi:hypothetical protein